MKVCWALAVIFVAGHFLAAQNSLPACDDQDCRAIRTVLEAAPGGFVGWRGQDAAPSLEIHSLFFASFSLPGFDPKKCWIALPGSAGVSPGESAYQCSSDYNLSTGQSQDWFKRLKDATERALPQWREDKIDGGNFLMARFSPDTCPGAAAVLVSVNHNPPYGDSITFALNDHCVTAASIQRALPHAQILVRKAPAGAIVQLDGETKGTVGTDGTLTLTGLRPNEFKLSINAEGYKPFTRNWSATPDPIPLDVDLEGIPLSESDLEDGLRKGIPPARMKDLVAKLGVDFDFNKDVEQRLRDAGADAELLVTIATNKKK